MVFSWFSSRSEKFFLYDHWVHMNYQFMSQPKIPFQLTHNNKNINNEIFLEHITWQIFKYFLPSLSSCCYASLSTMMNLENFSNLDFNLINCRQICVDEACLIDEFVIVCFLHFSNWVLLCRWVTRAIFLYHIQS